MMNRPPKSAAQAGNSWKKYSAAGMALAAAGVATQEADAAILYTVANQTMLPTSTGTLALDVDHNGSSPYFLQSVNIPSTMDFTMAFLSSGPYFSSYSPPFWADVAGSSQTTHTLVTKYAAGDQIGPGTWYTWNHPGREFLERDDVGPWEGGGQGFVGLRFSYNDTNYMYGWARIDYVDDTSMTLMDFALQTTLDTPIVAGDTGAGVVPEPSRALLLALGLGGAALRRRRQKA